MNTTPNINLSTYTNDPNDKFNLMVTFNENMTKIDTAVGGQNDAIDVIEASASTAVSTANTASATAEEALTTAEGKTSVNDNVASATTTYSSNKINELISGIQPGTEIDDTVTSTSKTWSSSKINTETLNNRKIIEYLLSGNIAYAQVVAELENDVEINNYNSNRLTYTVEEDSILQGRLGIVVKGSSSTSTGGGEYHPAFTNNYEGNLQSFWGLTNGSGFESGEYMINTKPTLIKAGTTVTLYHNNRNSSLTQTITTCEIRLKTISSILNS